MKENCHNFKRSCYLKILGTVWALTIFYVMFHFTSEELYIARFEGPFLGYLELFLNGYIPLNNFNFFPLINSEPLPVDVSFPIKIQGVLQSESWIPNAVSIFVILCSITGLPPHQLILLPLGVIWVPLVIFSILKHTDKQMVLNVEIILIGIYYIIFFIISRYYGSLYVAVFAMMLVFVILLCTISLFTKSASHNSFWILFIILIFSLAQYWHSALMMVLFIIISLCMVHILFYLYIVFRNKYQYFTFNSLNYGLFRTSLYLLLISSMLSITFTHVWESSYVGVVVSDIDIMGYLDLLISKLSGEIAFPVPYVYSYKDTIFGQLYFASFLGITVFCSFILIISIMVQLIYYCKEKHFVSNFSGFLGISLIISQIVYSVVYYNTNSINFPIVFLFFPIGAIYIHTLLDKKRKEIDLPILLYKKLFRGILIILIVLSVFMVMTSNLTNEAGNTPLTKYHNTEGSFNWLFNKMECGGQLIVDFNIFGKYFQREAQASIPTIKYIDLNPDIYSMWVGDEHSIPISLKDSISVVDKRTMSGNLPVQITGSRAALKQELYRINNCINLNKVYEDNSISLFRFV